MRRQRKERPDGFVLYAQSMRILQLLSDEAAGRAIKGAIEYFLTQKDMCEDQSMEYLAYSVLRVDIDNALDRFREMCQRNAENRGKGNEASRLVTSGDQNINDINLSESEKRKKDFDTNGGREDIGGQDTPAPAPKRKSFIPPTVEQVDAYIRERKSKVDAQRFVDFYTAKNWMVGKNRMSDWKAAVRTWEKRDGTKTAAQPNYDAPPGFNFI